MPGQAITMDRIRDATRGSITKELWQFMLPVLWTNLLQSLTGSVNAAWVGHLLGERPLAAILNANSVVGLLFATTFGITWASTILVGQRSGAGDFHAARQIVCTSAKFVFALSVIVSLTGIPLSEHMLEWMGTPTGSLQLADPYLRMILLSLPLAYLFMFSLYMMRATGESRTATRLLILSITLDVILNPILIFGAGIVPRLGIVGSAWATLISQGAPLVVFLSCLYASKHPLRPHRSELLRFGVDKVVITDLVRKGAPVCLQVLVITLGGSAIVALVNQFGVETAASYAAVNAVWAYIQMPSFAVGMAVTLMAAQSVGAKDTTRVKAITRAGLMFSVFMTGSGTLLVHLLKRQAYELLLPSGSAAVDIAVHISWIASWSLIFSGMSMVFFGVMRANGSTMPPLLIEIAQLLGIRFPFALALARTMGADAIWWSFSFSALLTTLVTAYYYYYGRWKFPVAV